MPPHRWDFCVKYVRGNLGTSIGSMFVKRYFDGQSKNDVRYGHEIVKSMTKLAMFQMN